MILLAYAAPVEGEALRGEFGARCVCVGVGKSAAAVGLCRAIAATSPRGVVTFGVCGAYPVAAAGPALDVGDLCLVTEAVLADDGVEGDAGFADLRALGLGDPGPFGADPGWLELARDAGPAALELVRCATVSTCSGSDARSFELARRTSARIETMESAALALACRAHGLPWLDVRCVSNRTGPRGSAGWQLETAVQRVQTAVRHVVARLDAASEPVSTDRARSRRDDG